MSEDGLPQPIEFFVASDASAIVEHTKRVLYLEDDDIAHISRTKRTVQWVLHTVSQIGYTGFYFKNESMGAP